MAEKKWGVLVDQDYAFHLFNYDATRTDVKERAFTSNNKGNVVTDLTGGPFGSEDSPARFDVHSASGQISILYDNTSIGLANVFRILQVDFDDEDGFTFASTDLVN